jgi:arylsulfatase A-like enzyme
MNRCTPKMGHRQAGPMVLIPPIFIPTNSSAILKKAGRMGKPFFAFAAFTSPHWPLQVDDKFWKKYAGKFDDGYEAWKERNMQSLQMAGMIAAGFAAPPNHARVKPWDRLTTDQQKMERTCHGIVCRHGR